MSLRRIDFAKKRSYVRTLAQHATNSFNFQKEYLNTIFESF